MAVNRPVLSRVCLPKFHHSTKLEKLGGLGGHRTLMAVNRWVLNPVRLPIPPQARVKLARCLVKRERRCCYVGPSAS